MDYFSQVNRFECCFQVRWEFDPHGCEPGFGYVNEHSTLNRGFLRWGPLEECKAESFVETRKKHFDKMFDRTRALAINSMMERLLPSPRLNLEAGKQYVTRNGGITSPLKYTKGVTWPWSAMVETDSGTWPLQHWYPGGSYVMKGQTGLDLVAEFVKTKD